MMDHIGNLQLLQEKLRTTMRNCFIQNHFNLSAQLIFTWTDDKFCQKQFLFVLQTGIREFRWEKNWPLLANLSEGVFIEEQCWHLE